MLVRWLPNAIDHQLRKESNLQTQPTDNPRSLLILCLELFELGDSILLYGRSPLWRMAITCTRLSAIALSLIVEPGCQVIERPEIQQVITKKIQLLDREGIDTIDHRISDGSNL
jgi:hypothetical protein